MVNTGFEWGDWELVPDDINPSIDWNNIEIDHGDDKTSGIMNLDVKAGCEVGVDVQYSAHAVAEGLKVHVLREVSNEIFEDEDSGPWGVKLNYANNGRRFKTFSVGSSQKR